MDILRNTIKMQAGLLDGRTAQMRFGIITSVNGKRAMACLRIQPEGVLTGWLPILTAWCGSGWGLVALPDIGDQVLVLPQEGHVEHGVIVGRIFSDKEKPPDAPIGELWLVHKSGSHIKLKNDGTVAVKGDLHVDGHVFDRIGSLDHLRQTHNQHRHIGTNGSQTGTPLPEDP